MAEPREEGVTDGDAEANTNVVPLNESAIVVPPRTVKILNYAADREQNPDEREIGFSARVFAQVSIPYRDPKDLPYWERKNGDTTLIVQPAILTNARGERYSAYPFGLIPRHALTWMATEAYMTKSPDLELGRSMSEFMAKIDLHHNGQNQRRLTDGLQRLFGSQMTVQGLATNEHGSGSITQYFKIADAVQLWFSKRDEDDNPGLWTSRVTLSDQFFRSIVDSPVPVDLAAMRALGSSPMRLDLYLWLTYRMSYLENSTRITWAQLNAQFGSQYTRERAFRESFLKNLELVQKVYPELNVEVTDSCLILRRSNTHIPKLPGAKRSRFRLSGDKFPELESGDPAGA